MNKTLLSLIVTLGVGFAFHFGLKPMFLPKEPTMIFNRYVFFVLMALSIVAVNLILRLSPVMTMRAAYVWGLGFYFYNPYQTETILYPPIPWTLFITYMVMWSIGTFLYVQLYLVLLLITLLLS